MVFQLGLNGINGGSKFVGTALQLHFDEVAGVAATVGQREAKPLIHLCQSREHVEISSHYLAGELNDSSLLAPLNNRSHQRSRQPLSSEAVAMNEAQIAEQREF